MTDHSKILDKIKKCLALSSSSNEHEAEVALRQARKLMDAHGVTDLDVKAAEAEESRCGSRVKSSPPNWEAMLATTIGTTFGCRVLFLSDDSWDEQGEWSFIGCGSSPEVSRYAFDVLIRQVRRARAMHIKSKLQRCKLATKIRRADLFCEGWVLSVTRLIAAFPGSERQRAAIEAYVDKHYPRCGQLKATDRNDGRRLRGHEYGDFAAGHRTGQHAQLNPGVRASTQQSLCLR